MVRMKKKDEMLSYSLSSFFALSLKCDDAHRIGPVTGAIFPMIPDAKIVLGSGYEAAEFDLAVGVMSSVDPGRLIVGICGPPDLEGTLALHRPCDECYIGRPGTML
jgi:hypothetical protein